MASYKTRRQARYNILLGEHFTPLESRELSKLPKNTPALKMLRADRIARWERFGKIAAHKISYGRWQADDVPGKWLNNLSRLYSKRRWRVQYGPEGDQQPMPKRSPNPWSMYRDYERVAPDKGYVSPWQLRQIKGGKTLLQKGLIFVQQTEKKLHEGTISKPVLRSWLDQKGQAIKRARGKNRAVLQIEYNRLERLL